MTKGYTIYTVNSGDGYGHFATLAEAKKHARKLARQRVYGEINVEKHAVVPLTKTALLTILETYGGSWSDASTVVATFKGKGNE